MSNDWPDNNPARTADALWGPGNWVRCSPCPSNEGSTSIHQKDFHANYEKPTAVAHPAGASLMCAELFMAPVEGSEDLKSFKCELPRGHDGRHGVPRLDHWGPDPV